MAATTRMSYPICSSDFRIYWLWNYTSLIIVSSPKPHRLGVYCMCIILGVLHELKRCSRGKLARVHLGSTRSCLRDWALRPVWTFQCHITWEPPGLCVFWERGEQTLCVGDKIGWSWLEICLIMHFSESTKMSNRVGREQKMSSQVRRGPIVTAEHFGASSRWTTATSAPVHCHFGFLIHYCILPLILFG